jgi:beta-phosphoglucomutase-like phosphatase (HAD superfamily)
MIQPRRAIVVAFDGLVADTLEHRASAVAEGIAAVGFRVMPATARSVIAGRTIAEAVRLTCEADALNLDETSLDIAALRATRVLSTTMRQPVLLAPGAMQWMARASTRARVIVRADSDRVHVEAVLSASGIADAVSLFVCADDVAAAGSDTPMFVRAWDIIAERCRALGVLPENLHGLECAYEELCTRVNGARILRVTSITEVAPEALQLS